jgi:hypothetical protein
MDVAHGDGIYSEQEEAETTEVFDASTGLQLALCRTVQWACAPPGKAGWTSCKLAQAAFRFRVMSQSMSEGMFRPILVMLRVEAGVPPAVEGVRPRRPGMSFEVTSRCLERRALIRRAGCPALRQARGPPLQEGLKHMRSVAAISF